MAMTSEQPAVPTQDAEDSKAAYQYTWERRYTIVYGLQLSVLYHRKRERYYDMLERLLQTLVTASATSGVTLLLATDKKAELWLVGAAAVVSMIQLAYSPAARARQHAQLASDYQVLWAEAAARGEHWTDEDCNSFQSKSLRIGATSPPQLGALVVDCENEIALAYGSPNEVRHVPFYMRWLKHVWNWDISRLSAVTQFSSKN